MLSVRVCVLILNVYAAGVIAHYFNDTIQKYGGCPDIVRTDCGTENVQLAAIQAFLRQDHRAHVYGTSPSNQRIEAWWSFLRCNRSQWWRDLFSSFVDNGIFHVGSWKETDCLRFCFMSVIRKDLKEVVWHWNTHRIRPSRGARCPPGIPDELYFCAQPPAVDCLHRNLQPLHPQIVADICQPTICNDSDFGNYLMFLCQAHGWQPPTSVPDAVALYTNLQRLI